MSEITLEDILIFEGVDYKETMGARGAQLNIKVCPSCQKESWKVYANTDSGLGNCFSCGKTFNVFSFCRMILTSRGAISVTSRDIGQYLNSLRKKLGYRPAVRAAPKPIVRTEETIELPTSQKMPYKDGWVHPYLLSRRIDGHYASLFDLRYSHFGSWSYPDDSGAIHKQSFVERIIIPVYDLDGKLVTFQGRDSSGASDKRYKFAGGLPGTGRYLYNAHTALQTKARRIVMCEGAFDVIGLQRALDTSPKFMDCVPVGSWGKHLSKSSEGADQVSALMRLKQNGLEEVYVCYDGEPAAYKEALKAAAIITGCGLSAFIVIMPQGQDPGDADAHIIISALENAQAFTRISRLKLQMQNPYEPSR